MTSPQVRPGAVSSPSTIPTWALALVVATVLITFGRLTTYEFLRWDDLGTVALNPATNPVTLDTWRHTWVEPDRTLYIPVTYSLWAVLSSLARVASPDRYGSTLNPMVFHGFNVLVHAGNTLLVLEILRRLIADRSAAVLGALLYAVHPIQVETVAWISGLKDLLWGTFSFLAILQYMDFAELQTHRRWLHYVAAIGCVCLAMLSKPTAMMTPLIIIAMDRLILHRRWRDVLTGSVPLLLLSLPCMVIARRIQTGAWINAGPLWARPLIVLDSLTFYISKLIWPMNLAPDYCHRPAAVLAGNRLMWTWLLPLILGAVAMWQRRRRPWLAGGFAVAVLGVLPMLGAVPFSFQYYSTTADHYLYVSMFGIALVFAGVASKLSRRGRFVLLVLIAICAVRSIAQSRFWSDTRTLFQHTLVVTPDSFVSEFLLAQDDLDEGNAAAAEPRLRRVVALAPDYPRGYRSWSTSLQALGYEDEAMAALEKSAVLNLRLPVEYRGQQGDILKRLGNYYLRHGNRAKAARMFELALDENALDMDASLGLLNAMAPSTTRP